MFFLLLRHQHSRRRCPVYFFEDIFLAGQKAEGWLTKSMEEKVSFAKKIWAGKIFVRKIPAWIHKNYFQNLQKIQ